MTSNHGWGSMGGKGSIRQRRRCRRQSGPGGLEFHSSTFADCTRTIPENGFYLLYDAQLAQRIEAASSLPHARVLLLPHASARCGESAIQQC